MPDAPVGFWSRHEFWVNGTIGPIWVTGYSHTSNVVLSVTPEIRRDGQDSGKFVITHRVSGNRLWPNAFPLERAQALCLDLLQLPGWADENALENTRLIEAATAIAKTYLADTRILS